MTFKHVSTGHPLRAKPLEQPLVIAARIVCRVLSHPGEDCTTDGVAISRTVLQPFHRSQALALVVAPDISGVTLMCTEVHMALEVGRAPSLERTAGSFHSLEVQTSSRVEFKDVTAKIEKLIADSGVTSGVCHVFVPHTSAAVLVQENADAALLADLDRFLCEIAPRDGGYRHDDGNCDAHLKASLVGCSRTLLIESRHLALGRWQGVFFCEFDGPRSRQIHIKIVGG
jgi:secondary thiamine-phosphate synthase enzyme